MFFKSLILDLNDFNLLLRDHKKELSSAHMNFTGFDIEVPEVAPSKKGEELGTSLPSYTCIAGIRHLPAQDVQ